MTGFRLYSLGIKYGQLLDKDLKVGQPTSLLRLLRSALAACSLQSRPGLSGRWSPSLPSISNRPTVSCHKKGGERWSQRSTIIAARICPRVRHLSTHRYPGKRCYRYNIVAILHNFWIKLQVENLDNNWTKNTVLQRFSGRKLVKGDILCPDWWEDCEIALNSFIWSVAAWLPLILLNSENLQGLP